MIPPHLTVKGLPHSPSMPSLGTLAARQQRQQQQEEEDGLGRMSQHMSFLSEDGDGDGLGPEDLQLRVRVRPSSSSSSSSMADGHQQTGGGFVRYNNRLFARQGPSSSREDQRPAVPLPIESSVLVEAAALKARIETFPVHADAAAPGSYRPAPASAEYLVSYSTNPAFDTRAAAGGKAGGQREPVSGAAVDPAPSAGVGCFRFRFRLPRLPRLFGRSRQPGSHQP